MAAAPPRPSPLQLRLDPAPHRPPPSAARIARRRWLVATAKRLLPVVAMALLACVVLWPELSAIIDQRTRQVADAMPEAKSGQLTDATYHGTDQQGQPYTLSATSAHEVSAGRVLLANPKGDISLAGHSWMMVQSLDGVFMQHEDNLDLSHQVQLYRDDGMILQTESANVDFHSGAATGTDRVHVEGPFGTLDAQGFSAVDRGTLIRFHGPGRMILNARSK